MGELVSFYGREKLPEGLGMLVGRQALPRTLPVKGQRIGRDERQKDLFRPPLDEIIDMSHTLVRLAGEIDWDFLDRRFAARVFDDAKMAAALVDHLTHCCEIQRDRQR